jgi:hypothetical protein
MKRKILPAKEIERNNRVKQVMSNRTERKQQQPEKLTLDEFYEMKAFMSSGYSRSEAIELVIEKKKLLNSVTTKNNFINDWNNGGFINDEKYKQPIKHRNK